MTGAQQDTRTRPPTAGAPSAGQTVRRLVVYTLLAVLVGVAATGLTGLLGLLLDTAPVLAGENTSSMAQSLAFTLIGGPLAGLLWWAVWRRLADAGERGSLAWGLYLSAVGIVSLIVSSTALLGVLASLIESDWDGRSAATALVWAAVWVWHYRMWRSPTKGPVRLAVVPPVLGASYGLVLGGFAAGSTLAGVFDAARASLGGTVLIGGEWGSGTLQSLVWALGGAAIWAWHWYGAGARVATTTFSNVALLVLGILGASIATLGGIGAVLYVLLRLTVDRADPVPDILNPLPTALAAAAVGGAIWVYARAATASRPESTQRARVLATSGVALAGAASGLGVVVNAGLGMLTTPIAGADTRTLLLGGLSALLIGAPVWWFSWRPLSRTDAPGQSAGRRIYLIAIFGISAVVALITLLVIGFRLFEFFLDGNTGLLERVRAPLGLLTATALVAGYHFGVWRSDRADADGDTDDSGPSERSRAIDEVVLVTGSNPAPLVAAIEAATGASVTVWRAQGAAHTGTDPDAVLRLLGGLTGKRVLVVATGQIQVIPLED